MFNMKRYAKKSLELNLENKNATGRLKPLKE